MHSTAGTHVSYSQLSRTGSALDTIFTFSPLKAMDTPEHPIPPSHISRSGLPQSVPEYVGASDHQSWWNNSPSGGFLGRASPGKLDLDYIASWLAQVHGVIAIYTSDSAGETHVWVILDPWSEETLECVYERQVELDEWFGEDLKSVDFHVMERGSADRYKSGWRKCQLRPI